MKDTTKLFLTELSQLLEKHNVSLSVDTDALNYSTQINGILVEAHAIWDDDGELLRPLEQILLPCGEIWNVNDKYILTIIETQS